ncbi:sugar dehydrogenase complex small subunit, partial [Paraburkholderia sp. SIMBA_049]
ASGSLDADQENAALSILCAWYLGIVDNVVITYEEALMFSVVSDTLVIPSYCPNKPGFWAEKPIERQA